MKALYEKIKVLCLKYKEMILYVIFGGLTTAVNFVTYALFARLLCIDYIISTIIAWIAAVMFAFVTNKLFVFESKSWEMKTLLRELSAFVLARAVSGGFDVFIMWLFVDIFGINDLVTKILSNVIVVIVNYIFSKFFIFKKKAV